MAAEMLLNVFVTKDSDGIERLGMTPASTLDGGEWVFASESEDEIRKFSEAWLTKRYGYSGFDLIFHTPAGDTKITIMDMDIAQFAKSPLVGVVVDRIAVMLRDIEQDGGGTDG